MWFLKEGPPFSSVVIVLAMATVSMAFAPGWSCHRRHLGKFVMERSISRAGWEALIKTYAEEGKVEEIVDEFMGEIARAENEKEEWKKQLEKSEAKRIDVKAEFVRLKSKYTAETNLRPIIEEFAVKQWPTLRKSTKQELPGIQALLNQYSNANKNYIDTKIDEAIRRSKEKYGKAYDLNKASIRREMTSIYHTLSNEAHVVNLPPGCPIGFVVNRTPLFSLAMSVFLMCADEKHTVMTNEYRDVVYYWPEDVNDDE